MPASAFALARTAAEVADDLLEREEYLEPDTCDRVSTHRWAVSASLSGSILFHATELFKFLFTGFCSVVNTALVILLVASLLFYYTVLATTLL